MDTSELLSVTDYWYIVTLSSGDASPVPIGAGGVTALSRFLGTRQESLRTGNKTNEEVRGDVAPDL
jgi:hypothetical protein